MVHHGATLDGVPLMQRSMIQNQLTQITPELLQPLDYFNNGKDPIVSLVQQRLWA